MPTDDDLALCLLAALRYALGRRSYAPRVIAGTIVRHLDRFSDDDIETMRRDVVDATPRFDPTDAATWAALTDAIRAEQRRRAVVKEDPEA